MRHAKANRAKAIVKLGFGQGLCLGLGAMALLVAPEYTPPRLNGNGLKADWRAVGRDIRAALRRADEFRKVG